MLRIGLTGGIGSGKSTAAQYFAELGITIIDADAIARELVSKNSPALADISMHFGKQVLNNIGELDREKLRILVFDSDIERLWLENLLHPLIVEEIQLRSALAPAPYCVLVIPLLLEKNVTHLVDRILVIDAPVELQLQRAQQRDQSKQTNDKQLNAILQTQLSRSERLAQADDILYNDGDLNHLQQQIMQLHTHYLQLAQGNEQG